jgi:hypothetical protein
MSRTIKRILEKESPTTLSIGRCAESDDGKTAFRISVKDNLTGFRLLDVQIDAAELMLALGNLMDRPCKIEFDERGMGHYGKRRETMSYKLLERKSGVKVPAKLAAEGWEHWNGYGNHHASRTDEKGRKCYLCTLVRYVELDDFEPEVLP